MHTVRKCLPYICDTKNKENCTVSGARASKSCKFLSSRNEPRTADRIFIKYFDWKFLLTLVQAIRFLLKSDNYKDFI